MQTQLSAEFRDSDEGKEAAAILRKCVHCGFCNATCPTYQLLGDELDGPRGRIYLIKQLLEGAEVTRSTQQHLDRCLTCLNCQTTCPSGVEYGHLVDIGRQLVEARVQRPAVEKVVCGRYCPECSGTRCRRAIKCRREGPRGMKSRLAERSPAKC
jgi:glycolate oxidase iron-sulfur subunit